MSLTSLTSPLVKCVDTLLFSVQRNVSKGLWEIKYTSSFLLFGVSRFSRDMIDMLNGPNLLEVEHNLDYV